MALERTHIIETALDLLDETGIEGVSMRKIGTRLGVQAPAIYWHFDSKQALFEEMAENLLAGMTVSIPPAADCANALRYVAKQLRSALLSRRDGARVFAGTFTVSPNIQKLAKSMMSTLDKAGFTPEIAARISFTVLYYVLGFVIEEQAFLEQTNAPESAERLTSAFESARTQSPHLAAVTAELVDPDQDARFAFGLDLIVGNLKS